VKKDQTGVVAKSIPSEKTAVRNFCWHVKGSEGISKSCSTRMAKSQGKSYPCWGERDGVVGESLSGEEYRGKK